MRPHRATHAVAHTSLIGGIIMAAGTLIVLALLPGHRLHGHDEQRAVSAEPAREDQHADTISAAE